MSGNQPSRGAERSGGRLGAARQEYGGEAIGRDGRGVVTDQEAAMFWRYIAGSIERLVEMLGELSEAELNWRPPAPDSNSLFVLATHTLANTEENILGTLCGIAVQRRREAEFQAYGPTPEPIRQRWARLRAEVEAALGALAPEALRTLRPHPRRGPITGREILIVVARHAAEHLGQAELTRDLMRAALGQASGEGHASTA